ncbi:MAG: protein kinase [Clostridia bacterium]|nr:protein kinase [Clostridia bacterium]
MINLEELLQLGAFEEHIDTLYGLKCTERIGKSPYVIDKVIHRSHKTYTYKVKDTVLNRFFVVKEFFPQGTFFYESEPLELIREHQQITLKKDSPEASRDFSLLKEQYKEDAFLMKRLGEKLNIIEVIDVFYENNTVYVVMPYILYPTLDQLLKYKVLKPNLLIDIYIKILNQITALHQQGYVYKIIKPSSIYITDTSIILKGFSVKLKLKQDSIIQISEQLFMAPEAQIHGELTFKSDLYPLGQLLNYMMEFVGYKHFEKPNLELRLESGRIDYVLSKVLEEDPNKREITIPEMISLLKYMPEDKSKNGQMFKWIFALLMMMVLSFIVLKWFLAKSLEEEVAIDEFQFLKEDFVINDNHSLITWETDDEGLQEIKISNEEDVWFIVQEEHFIDLSTYDLSPGRYGFHVDNDTIEPREIEFVVEEKENLLKEKPGFMHPYYVFYTSENKIISWENENKITEVKIFKDFHLIYQIDVEQNHLDLDFFQLKEGHYQFLVKLKEDDKVSESVMTEIDLIDENALKPPVVFLKGFQLSLNETLNWLQTDQKVTIEWLSKDGKIDLEVSFEDANQMKLSEYPLQAGLYELYLSSSNQDQMSEIKKLTVELIEE